MKKSINFKERIADSISATGSGTASFMAPPTVILWPDPEGQWNEIVEMMRRDYAHILTLGDYHPGESTGPAIWLKCAIGGTLPELRLPDGITPVIYLPMISKEYLRQHALKDRNLQPLAEYLFNGAMWLQENGKEWTIAAFLQNREEGMGFAVAQDMGTKELLKLVLPSFYRDGTVLERERTLDRVYLETVLFPEFIAELLKWMCKGESYLKTLHENKRLLFLKIFKTRYGLDADEKNILTIIGKFAARREGWEEVWSYFANAPHRYPEIEEWLRKATPPASTLFVNAEQEMVWPQINDEKENALRGQLTETGTLSPTEAANRLLALSKEHQQRTAWVWSELQQAPLANAVQHLAEMAKVCNEPFPSGNLEEMETYYTGRGYMADLYMRRAYALTKSEADRLCVQQAIRAVYLPWLKKLTEKYQSLMLAVPWESEKQGFVTGEEPLIIFADALRYETAVELAELLPGSKYGSEIISRRCALPSVTPTAKPAVSPVWDMISDTSVCDEFQPQFQDGNPVTQHYFRDAMKKKGYTCVAQPSDITGSGREWIETGEIDTKGHTEQAGMVKRIREILEKIVEIIDIASAKGVKHITIVTDHGWLLLPGGLPKEQLIADISETRWGRVAMLKQGASSELPHYPWHWNRSTDLVYAPGISFFRVNEEYAHGGISPQECIIPMMKITGKGVQATGRIEQIKWVNLRCTVQTSGQTDGMTIDIRRVYTQGSTSVVLSASKAVKENQCTLMADDTAESSSVTVVLLDQEGKILDKRTQIVGENKE